MYLRRLVFVVLAFFSVTLLARTQSAKSLDLRGARILTATDKVYDPGTLLVGGGKIVAVGPADQVPILQGAVVLVHGRVAYDRSKRAPLSVARRLFLSTPETRCCLGW